MLQPERTPATNMATAYRLKIASTVRSIFLLVCSVLKFVLSKAVNAPFSIMAESVMFCDRNVVKSDNVVINMTFLSDCDICNMKHFF